MTDRFFITNYAIDLSKQALTTTDVYDDLAIRQSIENIILTVPGERVFEIGFGSSLMSITFRNMNTETGERLLDSLINSINKYEPRVSVLSNKCKLIINPKENSVYLSIPYIILKSRTTGEFSKKLTI